MFPLWLATVIIFYFLSIDYETEETKTYGPGINAAKNKCK